MSSKSLQKRKIRFRIRKKVIGTAVKPRLSVFRSNKEIYAQCIDDLTGKTIVASSSKIVSTEGNKVNQAKAVGLDLAKKAVSNGIAEVVFDRGGNLYHGRVKALADAAREGGLKF